MIVGLKDRNIKARLLRETKLDLEKAVHICKASETATRQLKEMSADHAAEEVKKIKTDMHSETKKDVPEEAQKSA